MNDMPTEIWAWEEGEAFESVWSNFQPSNEAPKYIRADLHEQLKADIGKLVIERESFKAENERLLEALEFYANPNHWMSIEEGDALNRTFVAMTGSDVSGRQHGWLMAKHALEIEGE